MSEFTKAPWKFNEHPPMSCRQYLGDITHDWKDGDRNRVRTVGLVLDFAGEKESLANAHLIAAAPDMYEALIKAKESLEGLPHSLGYEFTHLPDINAALAKARGES